MAEIHRVTELLPSNQAWFTASPIDGQVTTETADILWIDCGQPSCVSGWTITFMLGYHGALMGFHQQSMGIFHGDILGISWIDSGYIQAWKNPTFLACATSFLSFSNSACGVSFVFHRVGSFSQQNWEKHHILIGKKYAWKQCNPCALFLHARKPYLLKSYCSCGSTSR